MDIGVFRIPVSSGAVFLKRYSTLNTTLPRMMIPAGSYGPPHLSLIDVSVRDYGSFVRTFSPTGIDLENMPKDRLFTLTTHRLRRPMRDGELSPGRVGVNVGIFLANGEDAGESFNHFGIVKLRARGEINLYFYQLCLLGLAGLGGDSGKTEMTCEFFGDANALLARLQKGIE